MHDKQPQPKTEAFAKAFIESYNGNLKPFVWTKAAKNMTRIIRPGRELSIAMDCVALLNLAAYPIYFVSLQHSYSQDL